MIRKLWNKIRGRSETPPETPEPPIQPIDYGIHVFMRQGGERLLWLEQRQRAFEERMLALEARLAEMDNGQGQAVTVVRMEFQTLTEAWKTSFQNQLDRHEEILVGLASEVEQLVNTPDVSE
jgi:hypothetical protein